ncbi:MAG: prolyl oligopeptidase family serine peptidase, partial [Pseudomonadota bacterium]
MRFSDEVICAPLWSPDGRLYAVSDRSTSAGDRWANFHRFAPEQVTPVTSAEAEYAAPPWRLGGASYGFASERDTIAAATRAGTWSLERIDIETGRATPIETPFTSIRHLHVSQGAAVFEAGSFVSPAALYRMGLATGALTSVREKAPQPAPEVAACLAAPEPMTIPSGAQAEAEAHAFFYATSNPEFDAPEGEKPPLVIMIHGGPTAAAGAGLNLTIPFFTLRGFAVVDPNYRGSTGFGRAYRRAMYGGWGKVDVEDCVGAVQALVSSGRVDPYRVVSRGGSSGGYTTLALATFTDLLSAAASYYGISNLEMIARITDKLEAQYAALLVGPYPVASKLFRARSLLFHAARVDGPIIFFQGTEDPVVPPEQARVMIDEMASRQLLHAFGFYHGESGRRVWSPWGTGFRR